MELLNSGQQRGPHYAYRADGVIISGSAPQLILPAMQTLLRLTVQNCSAHPMWVERGPARAHATITNGAVTSIDFTDAGLDNAGFNYTLAPKVAVLGGGGNFVTPTSWPGSVGQEQWQVPSGPNARPAAITAVLTSGAISSFVIDDPGAGYVNPPELFLINHPSDPFGCADPSIGSGTGFFLNGTSGGIGSSYSLDGTGCDTSQVAIFCATTGAQFFVEYML